MEAYGDIIEVYMAERKKRTTTTEYWRLYEKWGDFSGKSKNVGWHQRVN